MTWTWLRPALVTLSCALPAVAWAGGVGTPGTSSGTDTGIATDTDTDTGGTATGGSGTMGSDTGTDTGTSSETGADSSSGQPCSECIDDPDPVQIVSPADGDTVPATIDVQITAPYTCTCEGCACSARPPFSVNLRVDGMTVVNCQNGDKDCNTEDQIFTIGLTPGTHVLDAAADHNGQVRFSAPVEVTVPGGGEDSTGSPPPPPPPPPPSTSSGDSGSDTSGAPAADGGGGCGCHTQPRGPAGALAGLLVLLGLGTRRRRPGSR